MKLTKISGQRIIIFILRIRKLRMRGCTFAQGSQNEYIFLREHKILLFHWRYHVASSSHKVASTGSSSCCYSVNTQVSATTIYSEREHSITQPLSLLSSSKSWTILYIWLISILVNMAHVGFSSEMIWNHKEQFIASST